MNPGGAVAGFAGVEKLGIPLLSMLALMCTDNEGNVNPTASTRSSITGKMEREDV